MKKLAKTVINKDIIDTATTQKMLLKIDLKNSQNHLKADKVIINIKIKHMLVEIIAPIEKTKNLKKECVIAVVEILVKLQERRPLKSVIVQCAGSVFP